jgi:lipopolysaccharide/colanic/teichoic acid biosynthesis glycosyltransferase
MKCECPTENLPISYWQEEVIRTKRSEPSKKAGQSGTNWVNGILLGNLILIYQMTLNPFFLSIQKNTATLIRDFDLQAVFKRTIDIIGATVGLILSVPIWLIVSLAIVLDSRGPVFYTQERVGINRRKHNRRTSHQLSERGRYLSDRREKSGYGKSFMIIKFRSMSVDAEKATGPVWATKNDNRITRVGRILRAARLDEVPQLINVLKGDMSLVGPRPERPHFVDDLKDKVENYPSRFQVKPGITGLAQVEHKYDESIEDVSKKVSYDLKYIHNRSVFQDIKILFKTITVVVTMRGM